MVRVLQQKPRERDRDGIAWADIGQKGQRGNEIIACLGSWHGKEGMDVMKFLGIYINPITLMA